MRSDARARACGMMAAFVLTAGCAGSSPFRAVERSVRDELPRVIGPADSYDVTVSRSGGSLVAGRIPWINIHGRNVQAIQGLNLDDLRIRLEDVHFSRATRSVRGIRQATFEASLSAASVVSFLHRRSPGLRDLQVAFSDRDVRVHAAPAVLGIGVPVDVTGRPVLNGQTAIDFAASRLAVLRLRLPEFAIRRLEERINPLVDLASMPFPLNLTAVQMERDRVLITGTATLDPAKLKRD